MESKELFGILAVISLFAILLTEQGARTWMIFGFVGILFGVVWMWFS